MKVKYIFFSYVVCFVFSWLNSVSANIDQAIYNTIYNDWKSPTMDKVMKVPEYISTPTGLALSNLAVFYFGGEKEQKIAKLAVTSWTGCFITTFLLKGTVNRQRPTTSKQAVSRWNSSFPSGHTANYFSLATVYSAKYPKYAIPLYGFGVLVGLARIYQGEHYPSDVLGGAVIGIGIGYLTLKLEKHLKFLK